MYYQKYLKYKIKYNHLKNKLLGGSNLTSKNDQSDVLQITKNLGFLQDKVYIKILI
jgi:hypothetical protein